MSLVSGSIALRRFEVLGPVPSEEEVFKAITDHRFRPFQDGSEEERSGFVDWRNPLLDPSEAWMTMDRFVILCWRTDTRKVPAGLLRAHVDMRVQDMMKEKGLAFVAKEARASIQDEVKGELLRKVLPKMSTVDIAWDRKGGKLYLLSCSNNIKSAVTSIFMQAFGLELQAMTPAHFFGAKTIAEAEQFGASGLEFAKWLWMRGLENGGTSDFPEDNSALFLDDSVTFSTERGDCHRVALSKGNPTESQEAFRALEAGMDVESAKIRVLSGDLEWTCTLESMSLDIRGLKLPPTTSKDAAGRVADRLFLLEEFLGHLDRRLAVFAPLFKACELDGPFTDWINRGLAGQVGEAEPWGVDR